MKIEWSKDADISYNETIVYWAEHNFSNAYSEKIISETRKIEKSISENPYFLTRYHENIGLYQRIFFKGKFSLYYRIANNIVRIIHFRSNRQRPL
ncbi:MAG: type II toxin-antitoxin system RelE/ParE family toxin [Flavobacteriaceae bacterium]|nr:type II toxin-antitoxin system RelE/ParE family toxin [Flavobacteriaceae bacterium]